MTGLSSSDLARTLGVSKGRISQYVASGQLTGCFEGDGRQRRFDVQKVAGALGRRLDPGQMLGNGAQTKRTLRAIKAPDDPAPLEDDQDDRPLPAATAASPQETDRYEIARTQLAEEKARTARRDNQLAEGRYVLAEEVERQVSRALAQEVSEFESVLREAARKVADKMSVDYLLARQILLETWRAHRTQRAKVLGQQAETATPTDAEQEANI